MRIQRLLNADERAAGLAVGLAMQGSLTNLAGGIMILSFKPFVVGDFISEGQYTGTVKSINIFYTIISTPDNVKVVIPNGSLSNQTVANQSAYPLRRLALEFSASYNADADLVIKTLLSIAENNPMVNKETKPTANVKQHGDSAIIYVLSQYCTQADYWNVHFYTQKKVKEEFDRLGIEIPFPQLDVHTYKDIPKS